MIPKFRAFKKKMPSRGMYAVEKIDFIKKAVELRHGFHSSFWVPFHGIELMQYIRQKDKDDIEIYKKDILIHRGPLKDYFYVVVWHIDGYAGKTANGEVHSLTGYWQETEIIGNVLENPKLVRKTNEQRNEEKGEVNKYEEAI